MYCTPAFWVRDLPAGDGTTLMLCNCNCNRRAASLSRVLSATRQSCPVSSVVVVLSGRAWLDMMFTGAPGVAGEQGLGYQWSGLSRTRLATAATRTCAPAAAAAGLGQAWAGCEPVVCTAAKWQVGHAPPSSCHATAPPPSNRQLLMTAHEPDEVRRG